MRVFGGSEAHPAEREASGSPLEGGLKWFSAFGFPIVPRRAVFL